MINKVSFMGREECLTKPAKKVANAAENYFKPGTAIENTVKEVKAELPDQLNEAMKAKFMPIELIKKDDPALEDAVKSYIKSHGNIV